MIPVCVFAKPPVPGRVKTRLIPAVGAEGAARLAEAFLADTIALLEAVPGVMVVVATTEPLAVPGVPPERVWLQGDGPLGDRIERILRRGLELAPSAVALGADSPDLPPRVVRDALRALNTHDAVLGPTPDGGFYLLGVRRCPPGLLRSVPWSSSETAAATERALSVHGATCERAPPWRDVDLPADLDVLRRRLASHPARAPRTAAALAELAL